VIVPVFVQVIVVPLPTVKRSPAAGALRVRPPVIVKAAEVSSVAGWPASASTTLTLTLVLIASGTVQARLVPPTAVAIAV
jgi:hypothetical protein